MGCMVRAVLAHSDLVLLSDPPSNSGHRGECFQRLSCFKPLEVEVDIVCDHGWGDILPVDSSVSMGVVENSVAVFDGHLEDEINSVAEFSWP